MPLNVRTDLAQLLTFVFSRENSSDVYPEGNIDIRIREKQITDTRPAKTLLETTVFFFLPTRNDINCR